ncbi:MAG: hypothetical protein EA367_01335 [Leptolyngbya sp. DLM2.Bin15]|nr:MAG: hypothetical protein EA367_01335 [Leptolyngbya sp. DLM2.Bin15]
MDTSASALARLQTVLNQPQAPAVMWQDAFDYDPSHYGRLCQSEPPLAIDLLNYALDLTYEPVIQTDLLRFLLPKLLEAWREALLGNTNYQGFLEHFWLAIARRTDWPLLLSETGWQTLLAYMRCSITECLNQPSPGYDGIYAVAAYASACPDFALLWDAWWQTEQPQAAWVLRQWLSCLVYLESENPCFLYSVPDLSETGAHLYEGWRPDAIAHVCQCLSVASIEVNLRRLPLLPKGTQADALATQMQAEFADRCYLLELRLLQLPQVLANPWIGFEI